MIMKLQGKVALITGASRGIGKATALLFAKEGASVVVGYLNHEKEADCVVKEAVKLGAKAVKIKVDVSKESDVKSFIEQSIKQFAKIDILVNNAGIVFDVPFKDRTVDHWKKTLDVNLIGPFLCAKYAVKHMIQQKGACIVNVSSTSGMDGFNPNSIDYDASKSGLNQLTRDLAKELAPNIRVNAVAPGWVETDMNNDLPEEFIKEETEKIYLRRFADPEEIAKPILFLSCEDSSHITGSILKIDGGYG